MMSRRVLIASPAIACLGGCTITHSGNVIGGTLDVAKINDVGHAIISAISQAVAIPPIAAALAPDLPIILGVLAATNVALAGIMNMTPSGTATVSIDTTQVQTAVQTVITDAETVLGYVQGVVPALAQSSKTAAFVSQVQLYVGAAQTLLPIIAAAADLAGAERYAVHTGMNETRALSIAAGAK